MSSATDGLNVNRPLLAETLLFYSLPAQYMDASWWRPQWLPAALFERLRQNRRSQRHLSNFLVSHLGLGDDPLSGWEPARFKLAATPVQRLDRLVTLAGITLLSTAIAGVLRSRDRNRVTAQIGEQDYRFAVRRGRFLLQQSKLAQSALDVGAPLPDPVDRESRRLGMASLATALQNAPASLVRRTQLKFPRTAVEAHWQPLIPESQAFLRLFRLLDAQEPAP
ncbi:MAG: SctK family type III secretion system sorting platform protein [Gammaproteobacteria bacterium]|nr:SctK family type III secretion system sorting platform protein [Gammaproteobacteria bacterium]